MNFGHINTQLTVVDANTLTTDLVALFESTWSDFTMTSASSGVGVIDDNTVFNAPGMQWLQAPVPASQTWLKSKYLVVYDKAIIVDGTFNRSESISTGAPGQVVLRSNAWGQAFSYPYKGYIYSVRAN